MFLMNPIIIMVVVLLIFGAGSGYYLGGWIGLVDLVGFVIIVVAILYLLDFLR